MRATKVFTGVFVLALAVGIGLAGLVAGNVWAGDPPPDACAIEGPFIYLSGETGPLCSNPVYPYYRYECWGHIVRTGEPCDCLFIGCYKTPTQCDPPC